MIEPLEPRVAPAVLISPTTVTYQDIDGDAVTVKVSKPVFTQANVASIFQFSTAFAETEPQLLNTINLSGLPESANGLDLTVAAKRSIIAGGNNAVLNLAINGSDVDNVLATGQGIDLGRVSVQGDIARIDTGNPDPLTPALKSLKAHSIGVMSSGAESEIYGQVGSVVLRGNLSGFFHVRGGNAELPGIAQFTIGGSLVPADAAAGGNIASSLGYGSIVIKGSIVGGRATNSGYIYSEIGDARSITVRGSIVGGDGLFSGGMEMNTIGNLAVGGSIIGGDGQTAGTVIVRELLKKLTIGGDLFGGQGTAAGRIISTFGDIGSVVIKGSIVRVPAENGNGSHVPGVFARGNIGSVLIGGDLIRGVIIAGVDPGPNSFYGDADDVDSSFLGSEILSTISKVVINGDVHGTLAGGDSFAIEANRIVSVQIGKVIYKKSDPSLNFTTGIPLAPTGDFILREVN